MAHLHVLLGVKLHYGSAVTVHIKGARVVRVVVNMGSREIDDVRLACLVEPQRAP
jgi:hypothetical protein